MSDESNTRKKIGRPRGARKVGQAERDIIRIAYQAGRDVQAIAAFLGRGQATVYAQLERMKQSGEIGQGVLPLQVVTLPND